MLNTLRSAWPQVVGKAWADPGFRKELTENPTAVLKGMGIELPEGHQVVVYEDSPDRSHLVIPQAPLELSSLSGGLTKTAPASKSRLSACCEQPAQACCEEPAQACCEEPAQACCEEPDEKPDACCESQTE